MCSRYQRTIYHILSAVKENDFKTTYQELLEYLYSKMSYEDLSEEINPFERHLDKVLGEEYGLLENKVEHEMKDGVQIDVWLFKITAKGKASRKKLGELVEKRALELSEAA